MLSDYLGRHDYQVTAAHDGKTGLAKALGGSYSIMLLDVMLPGLDGFEVLRRLRAAASPMNVLLLTARGEDVDRIVGLNWLASAEISRARRSGHSCAAAGKPGCVSVFVGDRLNGYGRQGRGDLWWG